MIDGEGFRACIGIILTNHSKQVFWAKRTGQKGWQFPQGGINTNETVEAAMYRELNEETGLLPEHVEILACTNDWLRYRLPAQLIRYGCYPLCIGQKQIWYLLRLIANEEHIDLACSERPEFDLWQWTDYWLPLTEVVNFKRNVYQEALGQLAPFIFPGFIPSNKRPADKKRRQKR